MLWVRLAAENSHAVASTSRCFENDIPVCSVRDRDPRGEVGKKPSVVAVAVSTFPCAVVRIVHNEDVGLVSAVHDDDIAAAQILA